MPQLTLEQLFGVNSAQDGYLLIIQKSDLPRLTPKINNCAESLLVGILLKAFENFRGNLTDIQENEITDSQGNTVSYNNTSLFESLTIEPWAGFIKERGDSFHVTDTFVVHQFTVNAD